MSKFHVAYQLKVCAPYTTYLQKGEGGTRQSSDPLNLKVPAVKTEIYRNLFSTRCVNMWNEIPHEVKNAKNLNSFKNKLDEWLNY